MAERGLSPAMQSAIQADRVNLFYLLECFFDSGVLRATDAHQDIIWNSNVYTRTNGLLSFGGISETGELLVNRVQVTLSGVNTAAALDAILNDDFLDRKIQIYLGCFDADYNIIADPELVFSGRMDAPVFTEDPDGDTSTVTVEGTPHYADFGRKPGRHTNDEEQQFYFPGDKGFDHVSEIPKVVVWGRA